MSIQSMNTQEDKTSQNVTTVSSLSHHISPLTNFAGMQGGMHDEPKPALASGSPGHRQSRRGTAEAAVALWHLLTADVTQNLNTCLLAT